MIKKISKVIIWLVMSVMMIVGTSGIVSYADGSHGFYMTCKASVADKKTNGFMIDFFSDSNEALCTYWSNANWSMYTRETIKKFGYANFSGGGCYAGLQLRGSDNDRTGIMSMWRYEYRDKATGDKKYIYAKALYGKTTSYDNEGSGTSCVMPYDWKSSQWYRELLYCWKDEETGYTFIGTWFYDYEADQWTLFAYYNTYLVDSYINGDIGQFLENYSQDFGARYRSFRYRNIYFLSHETNEWLSSPTVSIRSDGNAKAFGEAKLGVSDDKTYVWASVDGKSSVDTDQEISLSPKLIQDEKPTVGSPVIDSFTAGDSSEAGKTKIKWEMAKNSTPQLSYKVVVTDVDGNELATQSGTRPEVKSIDIDDLGTDAYKCDITVTDVFGKTATSSYTSENYGKKDETPSTSASSNDSNSKSNSKLTVILTAVGAVVVVAAVVATVIVVKRKKNKSKKAD